MLAYKSIDDKIKKNMNYKISLIFQITRKGMLTKINKLLN